MVSMTNPLAILRESPGTANGPARLYALHLRLRPLQHGTLMPFSGELVHGAFLRWLNACAPDVVGWLHQGQKRRLFTCSSLRFNRPAHTLLKAEQENIHLPLDPQETYLIRITLLLGDLCPLLHEALTSFDSTHVRLGAPPFLRLGKQFFLLEEVILANDDTDVWTGFISLPSLIEQARHITGKHASTLTLDFATLTTFNRGNSTIPYGSYPLLLPLPQFVFSNLVRHWQELAPPELVGVVQRDLIEQYLQEEGVIIVDYDLKPHRLHFTTHQQRGFLGTCSYQLRGPVAPATAEVPLTLPQQIHLLAQLAFYSGIGYKTSMGLGQARVKA